MFHALPARWLAVVPACAALLAAAEPAPTAPPPAVPAFHSAFEGYRPFTDDKPIPWPQANETVRQRGGWKAYAQEAQDPAAAAPSPGGAHAGHPMPAPKVQP